MRKDKDNSEELLTSSEKRKLFIAKVKSTLQRVVNKIGIKRLKTAVIVVAVFIVVFSFSRIQMVRSVEKSKVKTAKEVVRLLYEFGSTEQLEEQQRKLRQYVSEDVYNQLTVDNEERRLNTYLKFGTTSSEVVFKKLTDNYLIYSLDCILIDKSRKFVFFYDTGVNGKIKSVRECELLEFIPDSSTTDREVE